MHYTDPELAKISDLERATVGADRIMGQDFGFPDKESDLDPQEKLVAETIARYRRVLWESKREGIKDFETLIRGVGYEVLYRALERAGEEPGFEEFFRVNNPEEILLDNPIKEIYRNNPIDECKPTLPPVF